MPVERRNRRTKAQERTDDPDREHGDAGDRDREDRAKRLHAERVPVVRERPGSSPNLPGANTIVRYDHHARPEDAREPLPPW